MAASAERAQRGAGPRGLVVLETVINADFVHRLQACSAASDAIWRDGWLACCTDGERGAWIEHYADFLEDRLDD